jgi:hypothetical protein
MMIPKAYLFLSVVRQPAACNFSYACNLAICNTCKSSRSVAPQLYAHG